MKRKILALALCVSMLLGGCGWMSGSYLSITPHQENSAGPQDSTLAAGSYLELRKALEEMVETGTENAVINISAYPQDELQRGIDIALHYIRDLMPLGAYAIDEIVCEMGTVLGQPAISVAISYIHGRSEIEQIQKVQNMEEATAVISDVLDLCNEGVVLLVDRYEESDLSQLVDDYALENPSTVMETPEVAVGIYPDSGRSRIVELKFTYQTSRESLRQMQEQVQRVFVSANLYVNSNSTPYQKYSQLFTFLSERFPYRYETSITPSYSLLVHGVGDSKAFASVYAAMCRDAGLECRIVSGTRSGEPRFWNMIKDGNTYSHVDLLQCREEGKFRKLTDKQLRSYVWDYSAYAP